MIMNTTFQDINSFNFYNNPTKNYHFTNGKIRPKRSKNLPEVFSGKCWDFNPCSVVPKGLQNMPSITCLFGMRIILKKWQTEEKF